MSLIDILIGDDFDAFSSYTVCCNDVPVGPHTVAVPPEMAYNRQYPPVKNVTASVRRRDLSRMATDSRRERPVFSLVLAVTAAFTVCGAFLGYALPAWAGLEEVIVLEMAVPISPVAVALYSGVTAGVFLVTFLLVVRAIDQLEENAV